MDERPPRHRSALAQLEVLVGYTRIATADDPNGPGSTPAPRRSSSRTANPTMCPTAGYMFVRSPHEAIETAQRIGAPGRIRTCGTRLGGRPTRCACLSPALSGGGAPLMTGIRGMLEYDFVPSPFPRPAARRGTAMVMRLPAEAGRIADPRHHLSCAARIRAGSDRGAARGGRKLRSKPSERVPMGRCGASSPVWRASRSCFR